MMARAQGTGLRALWFIAICSALLFVTAVSGNPWSHHHALHARRHAQPGLGHRWKRQANSTGLHGNSTLTEAELIVKAAQEEAAKRNKYIVEHVRRNRYSFGDSPDTLSSSTDNSLATGFNQTVTAAAAIVAESIAASDNTTFLGKRQASSYWMANMVQNGISPFAPAGYQVWRNVRDYGAVGDGVTDDTAAINQAITDGNRCGLECGSSSTLYAVVYFPPGTYLVSSSIVQYYFTQFIGDPTNRPTIKASPAFSGLGMISSNVYIEGGNSAEWYIPQSNFLRQVRNFVLDISDAPLDKYIAAIHWQVAQATSLQNIKFIASSVPGNNQQCMFMENGSGGFMSDLEFQGGALGAYVGNQQFTVRNLKFRNQLERALEIHWDWGWTWKGLDIANCPVGVVMSTPAAATEVGSVIFIDSTMSNVPLGIKVQLPQPSAKVSLSLFSFAITNVPTMVQYDGGATLLAGTSGSTTVAAWGLGKRYDTTNGEASGVWQDGAHFPRAPVISGSLLKNAGSQTSGFFERSKPQYESLPASSFVNLKTAFGAAGNGAADDTAALNAAFASVASSGKVLWIPAGVYIVTNTVLIPRGVKVVGQSWSQIMGSGTQFSDAANPRPVVKVGNPGDIGSVEIQDLLFTVRGATAGAVVLQWNIHESSPGSAAMWDTHIRVGGAAGSDLQVADCPKLTGTVNPNCMAASMLVHITPDASAYFENTWFWVADHDLDIPAQTQIDIYVARGFLIESTGPTWLYGTASEHCVFYQYQTLNAANIFMGMIQTESPYYQVAPRAPAPFTPGVFEADPTFSYCDPSSVRCAVSWGVRFVNSESIYLYGAGLYSWFSEYGQACVAAENCQDRIFEIDGTSDVWVYSLITKASIEMISPYEGTAVLGADNKINFCSQVMAWLGGADGSGVDRGKKLKYKSPISATVIPFPATTVPRASTFTLGDPVATDVAMTPYDGNQNSPDGPGQDKCPRCDLMRLITSTCCGVGGSIGNPVVIVPGTALPQPLILPAGFIPNQIVTDSETGVMYGAGSPIDGEITIADGTRFPFPFNIPAGLPFSDAFTPDEYKDDDLNSTLYIISDFWDRSHTVFCNYPCTLVFPPYTTTSTWTPTPVTTVVSQTTVSTTFPPISTQKIKISKTTVQSTEGSSPTQTIAPVPKPSPFCIEITIPIIDITVTFGLCPPEIEPFPPPIPVVTLKPPPPGTLPGPINPGNVPTPEQLEEEEEEEEGTCEFDNDGPLSDPSDYDTGWGGGPFNPGLPQIDEMGAMPNPPAAGTGNPSTTSTTVTVGIPRNVNQQPTGTVVSPTTPRVPPAPNPTETFIPPSQGTPLQPKYDAGTESSHCHGGLHVDGGSLRGAFEYFCWHAHGMRISNDNFHAIEMPWFIFTDIRVGVYGKNKCEFTVLESECRRVFEKVVGCHDSGQLYRSGGYVDSNCAKWVLDPNSVGDFWNDCIFEVETGFCLN